MTPDLERLADEAIALRATCIEGALGRHHITTPLLSTETVDHLDRARDLIAGTWASHHPALAQLANDRLAGIAQLADRGITPAAGCIVTVGRVTLEAVQDLHPVAHRYEVMRGRERAGWAWLSNAARGIPYVVMLDGSNAGADPTLRGALLWAAAGLDSEPLAEAGTR